VNERTGSQTDDEIPTNSEVWIRAMHRNRDRFLVRKCRLPDENNLSRNRNRYQIQAPLKYRVLDPRKPRVARECQKSKAGTPAETVLAEDLDRRWDRDYFEFRAKLKRIFFDSGNPAVALESNSRKGVAAREAATRENLDKRGDANGSKMVAGRKPGFLDSGKSGAILKSNNQKITVPNERRSDVSDSRWNAD
jgi:hypothetical protein